MKSLNEQIAELKAKIWKQEESIANTIKKEYIEKQVINQFGKLLKDMIVKCFVSMNGFRLKFILLEETTDSKGKKYNREYDLVDIEFILAEYSWKDEKKLRNIIKYDFRNVLDSNERVIGNDKIKYIFETYRILKVLNDNEHLFKSLMKNLSNKDNTTFKSNLILKMEENLDKLEDQKKLVDEGQKSLIEKKAIADFYKGIEIDLTEDNGRGKGIGSGRGRRSNYSVVLFKIKYIKDIKYGGCIIKNIHPDDNVMNNNNIRGYDNQLTKKEYEELKDIVKSLYLKKHFYNKNQKEV